MQISIRHFLTPQTMYITFPIKKHCSKEHFWVSMFDKWTVKWFPQTKFQNLAAVARSYILRYPDGGVRARPRTGPNV